MFLDQLSFQLTDRSTQGVQQVYCYKLQGLPGRALCYESFKKKFLAKKVQFWRNLFTFRILCTLKMGLEQIYFFVLIFGQNLDHCVKHGIACICFSSYQIPINNIFEVNFQQIDFNGRPTTELTKRGVKFRSFMEFYRFFFDSRKNVREEKDLKMNYVN